MASYHRVIGIDLGTTFSVVAAYSFDKQDIVVIPNRLNESTTPSVVFIGVDGKVAVGKSAKQKQLPTSTINPKLSYWPHQIWQKSQQTKMSTMLTWPSFRIRRANGLFSKMVHKSRVQLELPKEKLNLLLMV